MNNRRGFTMVEVLVVAILMMIVIGTIAVVFAESTEIVSRNESRTAVYVSAGYAMDRLANDFYGALRFEGAQRFVMHNGDTGAGGTTNFYTAVSGGAPETTGFHHNKSADLLQMRTVTSCANAVGQYQVTYYLKKDADPWRQSTARTNRPIYTLMRRVTEMATGQTVPNDWSQLVMIDTNADGVKDWSVPEEEACHYILSFNLEYYASNWKFSQLQPSPCAWLDPLGNSTGSNDTGATPYRIPQVRVTLIVVDDFGERSERMITHQFELPMG